MSSPSESGPRPIGAQPVAPQLSVVIPFHDEEANVEPLIEELLEVLAKIERTWELVCVDDGSSDTTPIKLGALRVREPRIKVIRLRRNFGQTAALAAGFDHARGDVIVSMDGDGQHDPAELPMFIAKIDAGYDVVSGWRQTRPDALLTRRVPSRIANATMAWLSGVTIHDFGTTFKAYRREILRGLDLYGDFHRFIPALAKDFGARIVEIPIHVRPREGGRSHYGLLRAVTVFFDLIRIRFLSLYLARPLQLLGGAGLLMATLGGGLAAYLVWQRLFYDMSLTDRYPLFTIGMTALLLGVQIFCLGLLGEIVVRLYFSLGARKPYVVDQRATPDRLEPDE